MVKTPDHELQTYSHSSRFSIEQFIAAMASAYPACYQFTLGYEGGYVNDPDDPGGCTNMGITIGTLEDWRGVDLTCDDVRALTEQEAALIYATSYWAPVWGSQLPTGINCQVWDFGVNAGPSRAIKYLQLCVGTTQDGIMGPNTLAAASAADQEDLLGEYHAQRQAYYESLSNFDKYGEGWTNRNNDCFDLSYELLHRGPYIPQSHLEERVARLEAWASSFDF